MRPAPPLGEFEQIILLALLRLGTEAYGASVALEIEQQTGRAVSVSAVHTTLDRLERKGLLRSWTGEPTAVRGGRRRKFYGLRPAGVAALRQSYRAVTSMAEGLEHRLESK